jgi:hypothetical protein
MIMSNDESSNNNIKVKYWNSGVTFTQLVGVAVAVIGAGLMFWKTTDTRISLLEIRMQLKEQSDYNIIQKLDKLQETTNTININLENKENRK